MNTILIRNIEVVVRNINYVSPIYNVDPNAVKFVVDDIPYVYDTEAAAISGRDAVISAIGSES